MCRHFEPTEIPALTTAAKLRCLVSLISLTIIFGLIRKYIAVSEEVEREKRMTQRASEFEVLISSLRFELEKAKGLATEYKNVADATERSLMEAKETGRLTEEKLNNR